MYVSVNSLMIFYTGIDLSATLPEKKRQGLSKNLDKNQFIFTFKPNLYLIFSRVCEANLVFFEVLICCFSSQPKSNLGGGFIFFFKFWSLPGEMIQFD